MADEKREHTMDGHEAAERSATFVDSKNLGEMPAQFANIQLANAIAHANAQNSAALHNQQMNQALDRLHLGRMTDEVLETSTTQAKATETTLESNPELAQVLASLNSAVTTMGNNMAELLAVMAAVKGSSGT